MSKYYVTNPGPTSVMVGGVSVPPYSADALVDISVEEAADLKAQGWTPRIQDKDLEQDTEAEQLDLSMKAAASGVLTAGAISFVADEEEIDLELPEGYAPFVIFEMTTGAATAAGIQVTLNIPAGKFHGQKLLLKYLTEADADDTITLASVDGFAVEGAAWDPPVYTAADTFVMLEWDGSAENWIINGYSAAGVTTALTA